MKNQSVAHKIISIVSSLSLLLQTLSPLASIVPSKVFAQEETPTPTQEITVAPTPTETITPEPTTVPSPTDELTPTPTVEVSPTVEVTPVETVSPTVEPTLEPTEAPSVPSPPDATVTPSDTQGQILDGASTEQHADTASLMTPKTDGHVDTTVVESYSCRSDSLNGCLTTDKADYSPTEVVVINGYGFAPNTEYTLKISSSDPPAVTFETKITTDDKGSFTASYQLDGNYRPNYLVELRDASGTVVASVTFTDTPASGCQNDSGGANDETGQKDLTRMCVNYSGLPTSETVSWNWDDISWSGGNTGDACSLYDTDGDGLANYALCVGVNGNPAVKAYTKLYSCSDNNARKCTSPSSEITTFTSTCNTSISSDDPFSAGSGFPNDTQASCTVNLSDMSGGNANLIDVCSFESGSPTSNPADCVLFKANAGKLTVTKVLSPNTDSGTFNLQIDGTTYATGGDGTTTLTQEVSSTTTHTVGETGANSTSLSDYSTSVVCKDGHGTGSTVSTTGSNPWTLSVSDGQDILCTITNTRQNGTIELKKVWSGTGGQTTLNIGSSAGGSQVASQLTGASGGAPLTTGTKTVNTGTYYVSESGGLTDYSSSLACTDNASPVTPGASNSLSVASGHTVICTFTNTRNTGSVKVNKMLDSTGTGTFVSDNPGSFTWSLDSSGTNAMGSTISSVNTGSHSVNESTVTNYHFVGWYPTASTEDSCNNPSGTTLPISISVSNNATTDITLCNARDTGTLTVVKTLNPFNDLGKFNLKIDGTTYATDVGDTGSTGQQTVVTGNHIASESAGLNTSLTDYNSSISCDNGASGSGTSLSGISVTTGANVTCTITNTRNTGTIELKKVWSGTGGQTTLHIGTSAGGSQVDTQLTGAAGSSPLATGANTVNTGTYYLSETGGLTDYTTSALACFNDADNNGENNSESSVSVGANDSVIVTTGQHVICAYTNTRNTGSVKVNKLLDSDGSGTFVSDNPGSFTWSIDGSGTNAMGATVSSVNTGSHSVNESTVTDYHLVGWYRNGGEGSCFNPDSSSLPALIDVFNDTTTEITVCNARDTGTLTVVKTLNPSTDSGLFNLRIDGTAYATDVSDTGSTGQVTVITGSHTVSEVAGTGTNLSNYTSVIGGDCAANGTVNVATGENKTCTIVNTKYGSIRVIKQTNPDESQENFEFDASYHDEHFLLTDGFSDLSGNLVPGTYSVSELPEAGWDLTSATCDDGSDPSSISLQAGEDVVCTFTNTELGNIVVVKYNDHNGNGIKDVSDEVLGDTGTGAEIEATRWEIHLVGTDVNSYQWTGAQVAGQVTFSDLLPNSFTLSEQIKSGWVQTNIACGDETEIDSDNSHPVSLAAGQDITCYIGNQGQGSLTVNKEVDTDGDGTYDGGNDEANTLGFRWGFANSNTEGELMGSTKDPLSAGSYPIFEKDVENYHMVGWFTGEGSCEESELETETPADVLVNYNEETVLTFCNARDTGTIVVHKQADSDGNGTYETEDSGSNTLGFRWGLDGGDTNREMGSDAVVTTGDKHEIDENSVAGYVFTGWYEGQSRDFSCENPESTTLPVSLRVTDGQTRSIVLCNQQLNPLLHISKSNNASGDKSPGDSVTYTITLTTLQNSVHNLNVIDLLPAGFKFHAGSAAASSSTKGVLSLPSQPAYASPGLWTFPAGYTLDPGEVLTLTLTADIDGSQAPGLFKDVTWADGTQTENTSSTRVLAAAQPEGFVSTNFVGTQVNVNKEQQTTAKIDVVGQVLGASTSLPGTGGKTIWVILAGIFSLFGVLLVTMGLFMRKKLSGKFSKLFGVLVLILGLAYVLVYPVKTNADVPTVLSIRLEQPKSPTFQDNFNITFVALDNTKVPSPITVRCFKKGPSDGGYSQFGSDIAVSAGGNTDNCVVTSSVMNTNGTYQFYATATNGTDNATSEDEGIISVDFNTSGPGTPSDYSKTRQSCSYLIHFKTSDDGGKTVKVEIYRSENTSFTLDGGTRVQTISVGSNTNKDITDNLPNCDKTYYYALRAFDSAGNGSGVIGDSVITTTTTTTTTTGGGAIPVSNANLPGGPGEGTVLGEKTGTTAGTVLGEATPSGKPEVVNVSQSPVQKLMDSVKNHKTRTLIIILILAAGLVTLYYVFKKPNQPQG